MRNPFAALAAIAAALFLFLAPSRAEASHFRYGTIVWTVPDPQTAPRTVRFTVTHAWRTGAVNAINLQYGDGTTSGSQTGPSIGSGTDVAGTSYTVHQFTVTKTYNTTGPFTVFFSGCCWISGLTQNSSASFRVETTVALAGGNTGGPVTTTPAIISLSAGAVRTYFIPVFDPDLDPTTCRFATTQESALSTQIPSVPNGGARPTLMPISGGCIMTWDLTLALNGQRYILPFVAESTHAGAVSRTTLEVIIEISSAAPPTCAGTGTFTVPVGSAFSHRVTGTNPTGGNLLMQVTNLPTGATMTPASGTTAPSPSSATFAWTPTMAFFGTTQIVLINYRNPAGLTGSCFLTIQVPQCNGFGQACSVGVGGCRRTGQTVCTGPGLSACNVTAGTPSPEICDNVDNDCDGMTDEGNANCSGMTPLCDSTLPRCVQCRNAGDCTSGTPVCDPTTRLCRACTADNECSGGTPACRTGVACVQCTSTNRTACTGQTSVCNTGTNRCVQCVSNTDCGGATPICNTTTNTCRPCAGDMDCGGSTPACATTGTNAGRCVQCSGTNTMACMGGTTVCNTTTNNCVGCTSNSNCGGTTPFCENNTCRPCRTNSECGGSTPACLVRTGACVQCTAGSTMACTGDTPQCNDPTNLCVRCLTSSHCPGEAPVCDRNECRRCMNDMDCGGDTPACNTTSGRCVQCTAMSAMACTGGTPVCNADSNRCVQCNTDTECSGTTPVCASNTCRACAGDMECAMRMGTGACAMSGACVQCTTANATACVSPTSVCNDPTNRCVQCNVNVECSGTTPVCDSSMCRACMNAGDCVGREGTLACATTGACVECTATDTTACTGERTVCDTAATRCVLCTPGQEGNATACATNMDGRACIVPTEGSRFCGCLADSDCGDATSGRVCDSETRRCVAGCAAGDGRNGCPMGLSCTTTTPGERGQCTMTCNRDSDCTMPGRTRCFRPTGEGAMPVCVECIDDSTCSGRTDGRTRCIGAANTCAQCAPSQPMACMGNMSGSACLNDGLCGCARDADCGGPNSGRVCDTMTRRCIAGCAAGEGRNGCPDGLSCTSDTEMVGMCSATCNRDADCRTPTPHCRGGSDNDGGASSMAQCVECISDTHCTGRPDGRTRCVNNTCAQCDPAMAMSCLGNTAGTLCTMGGVCGCRADDDCGPDQRCDVTANRCVMRPGMTDAGVDAGAAPRAGLEGGGCGCRVGSQAPSSSSGGAAVVSLLAGLALVARRRRRAA